MESEPWPQVFVRAAQALGAPGCAADEALRRALRACLPALGEVAWIDLPRSTGARRIACADDAPAAQAMFAARPWFLPDPCKRQREQALQGAVTGDWDEPAPLPQGPHPVLRLPLQVGGEAIGRLTFCRGAPDRRYTPADRVRAGELATLVAGRVASARLLPCQAQLEFAVELERLHGERARLLAEAEAARQQAREAVRSKEAFVAILGHELRNPLAPVRTALELMARRQPDMLVPERDIIGRQVSHLSRLVDDLLDVSRLTQGRVELQKTRLDLRELLAGVLESVRPQFEGRAELGFLAPSAPVWVDGDPDRLSQVVSHLLANAARFTPAGGCVWLRLRAAEGQAHIEVEDTGCGIDAELLPRVFDSFAQGAQGIDRSRGGLGLGLAIVRGLVQLHGGTAEAASDGPGRGARFTVRLPACGPGPEPLAGRTGESGGEPPDAASEGKQGAAPALRVLVVDDNTDAALMLAELLSVLGHEARTAADAGQALGVLDEFRPGLAVLDIGLPEVDGHELARRIRKHQDCARLPLVALTGYGSDGDRARALEAGFDEHLVKPVSVEDLLAVIERLAPVQAARH